VAPVIAWPAIPVIREPFSGHHDNASRGNWQPRSDHGCARADDRRAALHGTP
jgi:hypothetical protein